ncbi:MAG: hypothetical protein WA125_05320 [Desulfosporosinus sp.]
MLCPFSSCIEYEVFQPNSFTYYYVPIFAQGQGLGENESCMLIVTLIMIGIANSFGSTSRVEYFTSSKEANAYGQERAIGIYNFVDNIGESAGPMVLASIIPTGFLGGIIKLVSIFTGMNGLFGLSRLENKKSDKFTAKI